MCQTIVYKSKIVGGSFPLCRLIQMLIGKALMGSGGLLPSTIFLMRYDIGELN